MMPIQYCVINVVAFLKINEELRKVYVIFF